MPVNTSGGVEDDCLHRTARIPLPDLQTGTAEAAPAGDSQHDKAITGTTSAIRTLRDLLASLDSDMTIVPTPEIAPLVNWQGAALEPVHRWFRYREGFSPRLISELNLGHRLLDPFCGSGSIMVGAAQMGRLSVGVDVNPLATFISGVKLTPLSSSQIGNIATFVAHFRRTVTTTEPWPYPALRIARKAFEPDILRAVLQLRGAIEHYTSDSHVRDFLLLGWIAILEQVGSYFKEGNGIKYRNRLRTRDGYTLRVDGAWQAQRFGHDQAAFVWKAYETHLARMLRDTVYWRTGAWSSQRVIHGSALRLSEILTNETFDSIIFSPPYANRFDYFESQKIELWFGGFVSSYDELDDFRKASVRSHLGADLSRPVRFYPVLERLIRLMDRKASSWRMRVPSALRGYFDDMSTILQRCRLLTPQGRCHIVVGNSAYAGVIIPTDTIIARLGLEAGFNRARIHVVRHLTVAPQQRTALAGLESFMRESVVVLE